MTVTDVMITICKACHDNEQSENTPTNMDTPLPVDGRTAEPNSLHNTSTLPNTRKARHDNDL